MKNLPINKSPGPNGFIGKFHQKYREELTPVLLNSSIKLQRKENSQTHLRGHHHPDTKKKWTKMPQKKKIIGQHH